MANQVQLKVLRQGVKAWNEWRQGKGAGLEIDLREADFRGTYLNEANFKNADLRGSHFEKVGLRSTHFEGADLRAAHFHKADVFCAHLNRADLELADFRDADLMYANLREAKMRNTDFRGAILSCADFTRAQLSNVDFRGAKVNHIRLTWASLHNCQLEGTNLEYAWMGHTTLANLDLRGVEGLEMVRHEAPSTVGLDTIYASQGQTSQRFLAGCGVSSDFRALIGTLAVAPALYDPLVMLAYSDMEKTDEEMEDEDLIEHLSWALRDNLIRAWTMYKDWSPSQLDRQLEAAWPSQTRFLLVCSAGSLKNEYLRPILHQIFAREKEQQKTLLFPVARMPVEQMQRLETSDPEIIQDLCARPLPDFTNWENPTEFEREFSKLLHNLKTAT